LGHYYEEQGIETSFTLPGTIRVENEEDFSLLNVTTYTYDTNGNALTYNQDNYVDASARIISATYDTNGNLLTRERGNDVTTFTYNETVYDANGNWLSIASDANGDDYPDQLYTASWKQNGVMANEGYQGASLKNSNSLNPDFMSTYTHGPNGDRLTLITESGGTRRQQTFTYDRILDGVSFVDPRYEFFIGNPQNNLLTSALDENIIGVYTYDQSGNMLTDTSYADRSGVDRIITYTYDRNNNRLTKTVGKNTIQTWTYDAIGNPLTLSNDNENDCSNRMAGDGEVDIIFTYTYDSNGNLLAESVDSDADGVGEFNTTYTYDANGNLLSLLTDEISSEITIYTNLDSKIIRLIDSTRSDIYSEPPIF
jgi:YD repeat-containing protein